MTVYLDVLIALNLYINYFLILGTCAVMKKERSRKRIFLAALAGALGALVILLPELPFALTVLYKAAVGVITVFIAFGRQKPLDLAISSLFFLVISFTFAGLMLALWRFAAPLGMVQANGAVYFDIPLSALAAFTAAAYFTVKLARYIADRRLKCGRTAEVTIAAGGSEIKLKGFCDTGNGLCDPFSGKGVVICFYGSIASIVPEEITEYLNGNTPEGIKLIPCRTFADEALVPVFGARFKVDGKEAAALAGVSKKPLGEDIDCIFDPKIISL